jgi:gluconokinase
MEKWCGFIQEMNGPLNNSPRMYASGCGSKQVIVVVMGVSGSGKSTLAARLVERTGWAFAEGDDYHSAANRAKMTAGTALTDDDRLPWLDALHDVLAGWEREGANGILTCSALKQSYRERLLAGLADARLVWLDPPRALLENRLALRKGHYMNPKLLDSQLATLEAPTGTGLLHLAGGESADRETEIVMSWLGLRTA